MKLNKKYLIIVAALLLVLVSTIVGVTYAKYIASNKVDKDVYSENFYFTVDVLGDTLDSDKLSASYEFYGGDEKVILFNVQNYFDELRITDKEIKFDVSVEATNGATASVDVSSGSLVGKNKNDQTVILTVSAGYSEGTEVTVTIKSSTPYVKTMNLTFVLHTYDASVKYYVKDGVDRTYAELVITSNVEIGLGELLVDYSKINVDSNLLQVDLTNYYLLDDDSGILTTKTNDALNEGKSFYNQVTNTVVIKADEAIVIRFFKSDITKNYTIPETILTKNSNKYTIILG
ncbi:MAG: hypothetical protein IJX78_07120 [Bacilli bacterium]|nr:hypothetical protein [Bacilli bacterium]